MCDGDGEEENEWETATSFVCNNPFATFEATKNYPKHFHNSGDIKKKANNSRKWMLLFIWDVTFWIRSGIWTIFNLNITLFEIFILNVIWDFNNHHLNLNASFSEIFILNRIWDLNHHHLNFLWRKECENLLSTKSSKLLQKNKNHKKNTLSCLSSLGFSFSSLIGCNWSPKNKRTKIRKKETEILEYRDRLCKYSKHTSTYKRIEIRFYNICCKQKYTKVKNQPAS